MSRPEKNTLRQDEPVASAITGAAMPSSKSQYVTAATCDGGHPGQPVLHREVVPYRSASAPVVLATTVAARTAAVTATMSLAVLKAILIGWSRVAMLTTVAAIAMQMTAQVRLQQGHAEDHGRLTRTT